MALILNIETSTEVCSVALARDGKVVECRESLTGQNHAQLVTMLINEVLESASVPVAGLNAVAVSGGPGSYTGLRIGVSVAKGICYAADLPLIAITSLEAMAWHVIQHRDQYQIPQTEPVVFCPMIDARRMEVYTAFYDIQGAMIRPIQADVIDHQSYHEYLDSNKVLFFGNGAAKCHATITHPNALFLDQVNTSARNMSPLGERDFLLKKFVDVAYYEPFYLKDFIATVPVKNIFRNDLKS